MKPDTTCYRGERTPDSPDEKISTVTETLVTVDREFLSDRPSQRLRNHSPDGFNWGYAGSGPAQLALAILLDFTGDEGLALHHYQDFKFKVIATIPDEVPWELRGKQIRDVLEELERERPYIPDRPVDAHLDDAGD